MCDRVLGSARGNDDKKIITDFVKAAGIGSATSLFADDYCALQRLKIVSELLAGRVGLGAHQNVKWFFLIAHWRWRAPECFGPEGGGSAISPYQIVDVDALAGVKEETGKICNRAGVAAAVVAHVDNHRLRVRQLAHGLIRSRIEQLRRNEARKVNIAYVAFKPSHIKTDRLRRARRRLPRER